MSIRPFLSATKEDLDADCRPGVIDSVRTILNEEPVTMETWETEYGDPIEVCRAKIENSTITLASSLIVAGGHRLSLRNQLPKLNLIGRQDLTRRW